MKARLVLTHIFICWSALMFEIFSVIQVMQDDKVWILGVVTGGGVLLLEVVRVVKFVRSKWSS